MIILKVISSFKPFTQFLLLFILCVLYVKLSILFIMLPDIKLLAGCQTNPKGKLSIYILPTASGIWLWRYSDWMGRMSQRVENIGRFRRWRRVSIAHTLLYHTRLHFGITLIRLQIIDMSLLRQSVGEKETFLVLKEEANIECIPCEARCSLTYYFYTDIWSTAFTPHIAIFSFLVTFTESTQKCVIWPGDNLYVSQARSLYTRHLGGLTSQTNIN